MTRILSLRLGMRKGL